jgi:NitT/TauT family transport system substrate-binding protein
MTKMRRFLAAAGVVALLYTAAACGGNEQPVTSSEPGAPAKVNVGVIAIVDVAPIYLGKQKNFFTEQNIDLTLTPNQGGAVIVPGVANGDFQFGFSNVTSLMLATSRGVPVKIVSNGVASTGEQGNDFSAVIVKADSPIRTPADLVGRNVSANTLKNIGDTTIRASVRKAGGDPNKVKFTEMPLPDMAPALAANRVDAIWVVEPFRTLALNQGHRVVASNFVDAAPNLTVATYFTSTKLARENPDLVKRFTTAMQKSLDYADKHPDEVRAILASYTQIAPEVAAKLVLPKWPSEINRESVKTLGELAVGDGLMEKQPDLDALLP